MYLSVMNAKFLQLDKLGKMHDRRCGFPKNHLVPNTQPKPTLLASVNMCRVFEVNDSPVGKKALPLKCSIKRNKTARSVRASLSRLRWWDLWMPLVRSVILLWKVLPRGTTAQSKFNDPWSDCNSRSWAVRFLLNALIVCLNLINLSAGRRISKFSESISNPMSVNVVVGNTVFSDLIGRLISWAKTLNDANASWHSLVPCFPRKRKSSRICTQCLTENLFLRIQWREDLKFFKRLHA